MKKCWKCEGTKFEEWINHCTCKNCGAITIKKEESTFPWNK